MTSPGILCHWSARSIAATLIAASIFVGSFALSSAQSPGPEPIGPNDFFGARVNGSTGYPDSATIFMACFGPIRPGQTGHPLPHQNVSVFEAGGNVGHFGFTGPRATSIGAFFGPPPPGATSAGYVPISHYDTRVAIPTSLTLPCAGSGTVTFVPLPMSPPTSRSLGVPVRFVGQP
jgi:hypothetical protein